MILLVLLSIYIFRQYAKLAKSKRYPHVRWGVLGLVLFIGIGYGSQFIAGIVMVLTGYDYLIDRTEVEYGVAFAGMLLGGLVCYLTYKYLQKKPVKEYLHNANIDEFGANSNDENFER